MDLYSAAKRLTQPYVFTHATQPHDLPIAARGIIGDGYTCALVRPDGAIDWLCLPRFDSPSAFGQLLDAEHGGMTTITPVQRPFESLQRYDPGTNVLETLFRVPNQGVIRITDFMPWTDDPRSSIHEVHRRIQCVEGEVDLEVIFDPRFNYGANMPEMVNQGVGVLARGEGGEHLVAVLSGEGAWQAHPSGGVHMRFTMRSNERRWMVLSWDAPRAESISAYRPHEHLRSTRRRWREWSGRFDYDGPWRHHVLRSALTLKLLIYAPTGGMVAAPTMALPELIGGERNWDYRYVWSRDASMSIRAANLTGYTNEARDFFHFIRDVLDPDQAALQVMYSVEGGAVPEERTLAHMSGFRHSKPVRIGNGARDQLQLDTIGALVDAASLYEGFEGELNLRMWRRLRELVNYVASVWREPDHGIWEQRTETRHNVHSKLMSWVSLDRGARLASLFGDHALHLRWQTEARVIHDDVCRYGLNSQHEYFVGAYGRDYADSSLLLLPIHGFLPPEDPRIASTIARVRSELGAGPFLYRYHMDDGLEGGEGAFLLCGFWLAEALAMAGLVDEAQEVFLAHAELSNHLGLLAEEVDPTSREMLGNFPQAFSHLGLINAAMQIDIALRHRDEGSSKMLRVSSLS